MKSRRSISAALARGCPRFCAAVVLAHLLHSTAHAQPLYLLGKGHALVQTSAAEVTGVNATPFGFNALMPTAATIVRPNGAAVPTLIAPFTFEDGFVFEQSFATEAALDEAFPYGVYSVSGSGSPSLNINFPSSSFASVPRITGGGTWNAGGVLVVNPTQAVTLTFSAFPEYNAAGAAGNMRFELSGFQDSVSRETEIFSVPLFGDPATPAPLTGHTIPANTLTNGRLYAVKLGFGRYPTLESSLVPGSLVAAGYGKEVTVFVAALTSGTGGAAPAITAQPTSRTAALGSSTTFTVAATSTGTRVMQWLRNGDEISRLGGKYVQSADGLSLTVNTIVGGDAGHYNARIITTGGVVTSAAATLTVPVPPVILAQPTPQTTTAGGTVTFSVQATGTGNTYQWRRDGVAIPGATNATLTLQNTTAADAGIYTVVVTNSLGSVTSSAGALTVANASAAGRLINLSILTSLAAADSFTMGYVVGGAGTTGAKPLVIRAAGPSLTPLNVADALADPKLELFAGQTKTGENDNWGGAAGLANAMAAVGAFAFTGGTSRDAAIAVNIATSDNSVRVSPVGALSGAVLAELYDATPSDAFTATTPRLVNVSVLKNIGSGLTVGFVIGGSTPKTVLVRAIGPTLAAAPFNVAGTVADPQLALFLEQNKINENNDWGGSSALTSAFDQVSAFSLPANSRDAALLATLAPGNYTVQVSGVGNTTGTALVEVYEVP